MASNKCSQEQTWPIGGKKELNYIYCQQLATLFIKTKWNDYSNLFAPYSAHFTWVFHYYTIREAFNKKKHFLIDIRQ